MCCALQLGENGIIDADAKEYENYDISQLLLSELFGMQSSRSPQWDGILEEQKKLLEKDNRTEEEDSRLSEIDNLISRLSFGDSMEQVKSRELLYKIAKHLNIE